MNVEDLTDTAVARKLGQIAAALQEQPPEVQRELLQTMCNHMDLMDEEDCFGTEGWRHALNIPD